MSQFEEGVMLGKLPPDELRRNVLRYAGAPRKDLIVGGGLGEDAALIRWPDAERFLVVASDPIVGASEGAGELLVHVNTGVAIAPGVDFDPIDGHKYVRVSFCVSLETIRAACDRLRQWLG